MPSVACDQDALTEHIEKRLTASKQISPMIAISREGWARILAALRVARPKAIEVAAPITMILHCPKCRHQHIDEAEPEHLGPGRWMNPPHKTHLCRLPEGCGHLWRPADVHTTGVEKL